MEKVLIGAGIVLIMTLVLFWLVVMPIHLFYFIKEKFGVMTFILLIPLILFILFLLIRSGLLGIATIPAGYWVYRRHKRNNAKPSEYEQLSVEQRRELLRRVGGKKQAPLPFD
jgi:hypothetical protein